MRTSLSLRLPAGGPPSGGPVRKDSESGLRRLSFLFPEVIVARAVCGCAPVSDTDAGGSGRLASLLAVMNDPTAQRRGTGMRRIVTIVGPSVFAVLSGVLGILELAAARYAWGALLIAGGALLLHGVRLQGRTDPAALREESHLPGLRVIERAVQFAWAFAGGAAVSRAVLEGGAGTEAGTLYTIAAAICALGLLATVVTEIFVPPRSEGGW